MRTSLKINLKHSICIFLLLFLTNINLCENYKTDQNGIENVYDGRKLHHANNKRYSSHKSSHHRSPQFEHVWKMIDGLKPQKDNLTHHLQRHGGKHHKKLNSHSNNSEHLKHLERKQQYIVSEREIKAIREQTHHMKTNQHYHKSHSNSWSHHNYAREYSSTTSTTTSTTVAPIKSDSDEYDEQDYAYFEQNDAVPPDPYVSRTNRVSSFPI